MVKASVSRNAAIGGATVTRTQVRLADSTLPSVGGSRSGLGHIGDSLGEGLRRFLRQVVSDPAGQRPVLVGAGEFLSVCCGFGMRRAVGVAFQGDGRNADHRCVRQPLLEIVVPRLTLRQASRQR
jgi:hypothetical protein